MLKIDNFISLFEGAVRDSWDRPALTDFRKSTITYRELAERIETLDLVWKKAGLRRGDKIAINTRPCALGASIFYAAVSKGYVAVQLYNAFTPTDTQRLVAHSDSRILYTEKRIFDAMDFGQMPRSCASSTARAAPCSRAATGWASSTPPVQNCSLRNILPGCNRLISR